MPKSPRIGLWGNYGFQKPFRPLGRWIGPQFPDYIIGTPIEQDLQEGVLVFHVNVLFDRQKPRNEQLETILVLDTHDFVITNSMWLYNTWKKENEDADVYGRTSQNGNEIAENERGSEIPW